MRFAVTVIASILCLSIFDANAFLIAREKIVEHETLDEFKVHIRERGTNYTEKIIINEKDDLEYFHVPAHNGIPDVDYLYDFKGKISVQRMESEAKCYVGPLPENLPKPADLNKALQRVTKAPSESNFIVRKYWAVSDQVDKTLLRPEVQEFCGHFPVFRLQEVDVSSMAVDSGKEVNVRQIRSSTSVTDAEAEAMKNLPFCDPIRDSLPKKKCDPTQWIHTYKVEKKPTCTHWLPDCRFSGQSNKVCEEWEHLYTTMICYKVRCP